MPENFASMIKTLENDALKLTSSDSCGNREPRKMFLDDRLRILKSLKLYGVESSKSFHKSNPHLGKGARIRAYDTGHIKCPRSKSEAAVFFNRGRSSAFGAEIVRLSKAISSHLESGDGSVPSTVLKEFSTLSTNPIFLQKNEHDHMSQSHVTCGPGSYDLHDPGPSGGSRFSKCSNITENKFPARQEAADRIKRRPSCFRTSTDWGVSEQMALQRLYEEFGRPRGYVRGDFNYEEHLDKYAIRHRALYRNRSIEQIKERVHHCFKLNRFSEIGEMGYWDMLKSGNEVKQSKGPWALSGHRNDEKPHDEVPTGDGEPYAYR